jgi:hypothetical protein
VTWTGAGIARNMRNQSGFPRINTSLTGQMIRFDEGTGINFSVEDTAGTRTTPFWINASSANASNFIGSTGTFTSLLANSFVYNSDRKLKTNITPITSALDKVKELQGVSFNWKTDKPGDEKKLGFIAQDVEKVFPEAVVGSSTKGVEYGNLVAPLVEAVKEQQTQIDSQKKEIDSLKADKASLEKRLDAIEKKLGL